MDPSDPIAQHPLVQAISDRIRVAKNEKHKYTEESLITFVFCIRKVNPDIKYYRDLVPPARIHAIRHFLEPTKYNPYPDVPGYKAYQYSQEFFELLQEEDWDKVDKKIKCLVMIQDSNKKEGWRCAQYIAEHGLMKIVDWGIRFTDQKVSLYERSDFFNALYLLNHATSTVAAVRQLWSAKEKVIPLLSNHCLRHQNYTIQIFSILLMRRMILFAKQEEIHYLVDNDILTSLMSVFVMLIKKGTYSGIDDVIYNIVCMMELGDQCCFKRLHNAVTGGIAKILLRIPFMFTDKWQDDNDRPKAMKAAMILVDALNTANTKKGTLFKQMPREERFELSRDDPLVVFCSNRWCGKLQQKGERFNNCGKCRLSYYCSPACQKVDWRKGKHKQTCAPMTPKPKLVRNFSMD